MPAWLSGCLAVWGEKVAEQITPCVVAHREVGTADNYGLCITRLNSPRLMLFSFILFHKPIDFIDNNLSPRTATSAKQVCYRNKHYTCWTSP
jgi:hypothetical protein